MHRTKSVTTNSESGKWTRNRMRCICEQDRGGDGGDYRNASGVEDGGRSGKRENILNKLNMMRGINMTNDIIKTKIGTLSERIPNKDTGTGLGI